MRKSFNKDIFIAPGVSIEEGESAKQALMRELYEEFQIYTQEVDFEFFGEFEAKAADQEDKIVIMEVFLVHKRLGEPNPDNEVEEIAWISSTIPNNTKVGSILEHEVIPRLKAMDVID